jgi:peptide-methionine (S)-S-oxide reductase
MNRMMTNPKTTKEAVTLAGGCFWCLQPVFQELRGVEKVEVGYSGGKLANPSYEAVCTDTTGHAEAVQVTFDPNVITLPDILRIFFSVHDPTTKDRQGADFGTQYRSAIFYSSPEQEKTAKQIMAEIDKAGIWGRPLVTELAPLTAFYRAEEYHQDYFRKNPTAGYCRVVIAPKVAKFRKQFSARLKATAVSPKGT